MRITPAHGSFDPCIAEITRNNLGHFKMPNSERILSTIKPFPSPRDEPVRSKLAFEVISGSLDRQKTSLAPPAAQMRRILAHWPWAWLALAGVVTIAWAIALGWAGFSFVGWIFD